MSKLMDICNLVNYDKETRTHDRSQSICGTVLLDEESGYFEGITKTYDEKDYFLVFGTFNCEEGLHMYACNERMENPKEIINQMPLTRLQGQSGARIISAEFKNDSTRVMLQDGDIFRDVTDGEISMLKAKVELLKQDCNLVSDNRQMKLK